MITIKAAETEEAEPAPPLTEIVEQAVVEQAVVEPAVQAEAPLAEDMTMIHLLAEAIIRIHRMDRSRRFRIMGMEVHQTRMNTNTGYPLGILNRTMSARPEGA